MNIETAQEQAQDQDQGQDLFPINNIIIRITLHSVLVKEELLGKIILFLDNFMPAPKEVNIIFIQIKPKLKEEEIPMIPMIPMITMDLMVMKMIIITIIHLSKLLIEN